MAGDRLEAAGEAVQLAGDAELSQERRGVVVDPLADQVVAVEDEDREEGLLEAPAGGRESPEPAGVSAVPRKIPSIATVSSAQLDDLGLLIGEGPVELPPVGQDLLRSIVDLVGRDVLVAGMLEGRQRRLEVTGVLRLDVLADRLHALADRHRGDSIPRSC